MIVDAALRMARSWKVSPKELLFGAAAAAAERAGFPLPVLVAALLPIDAALRGWRHT